MFGIPDLKPFLKPLDSGYIQTLHQHIWVEFVSYSKNIPDKGPQNE